jgi:YteA family regulatory protein
MSNQDLLRKRLTDRMAELETKLRPNTPGSARQSLTDFASGELSTYDNHPADTATQLYEREKDLALDRQAEAELEDIRDALKRMDDGTYGIDEKTGKKISEERLMAIPTARTDVAMAPPKHSHKVRPAEESVIEEMMRLEGGSGNNGKFDETNAFDLVSLDNDRKMIHEDNVTDRDEEQLGTVEDLDAWAATDIDGYTGDEEVRIIRRSPEKK